MKKMIAMLMIGAMAAAGTASAMAAPADHKAPSHQVHKKVHKAPSKHNVKHPPQPMKHKAPIKHNVKHPAGPAHKLPPKHR